MTRETSRQAGTEGTIVSLADVSRFDWHRRRCPVCSVSKYAWARCPEGARLARRATQVAGSD